MQSGRQAKTTNEQSAPELGQLCGHSAQSFACVAYVLINSTAKDGALM
jgi:hypothetical protein